MNMYTVQNNNEYIFKITIVNVQLDYIQICYGLKNVYNISPDFEILGGQFQ